jgi:hypothetical protein
MLLHPRESNDRHNSVHLYLSLSLFLYSRLLKLDFVSNSDPLVVLYVKDASTGLLSYRGQTELRVNTHNPTFDKTFRVDVARDLNNNGNELLFKVYDGDDRDEWQSLHLPPVSWLEVNDPCTTRVVYGVFILCCFQPTYINAAFYESFIALTFHFISVHYRSRS